jgi:hypothetical protein
MIGTPPDLVLTPPPLRLDEPFREPAEHAAHDHADKRADYRKPRVVRPEQNVRTLRRAGGGQEVVAELPPFGRALRLSRSPRDDDEETARTRRPSWAS